VASRAPATRDADLLAAYFATRWVVPRESSPLEVRLGTPFAAHDLLPCSILTGCNPRSELRSEAENAAANQRLLSEIVESGGIARGALALGTGPDAERWTEPGFLVTALELSEAVDLGTRFRQNAIVWISADGIPVLVVTRRGFAGLEAGARLTFPPESRGRDAGS
jgi:hypothetical protein